MALVDCLPRDGKVHFRAKVRLRGYPSQSRTFERKTDAKRWIQQMESAMRDGRHFKNIESRKHTLSELFDRLEPSFWQKEGVHSIIRKIQI